MLIELLSPFLAFRLSHYSDGTDYISLAEATNQDETSSDDPDNIDKVDKVEEVKVCLFFYFEAILIIYS
jgi:hypothetical protein